MDVKYPNIEVKLVGEDGNAFRIIGAVKRALKAAHVPDGEVRMFMDEAMMSDYNNLLCTCLKWVNVT